MRSTIIISVLILFAAASYSQKDTVLYSNKTLGYITGSQYLPFAFGLGGSANIEFPVYQKKSLFINLKGTFGIAAFGDYDGGSEGISFATVSSVFLLGKGRSKFELQAGIGTLASTGPRPSALDGFIPTFAIGARYYRDNQFVRGSIGFPEILAVSYGIYF